MSAGAWAMLVAFTLMLGSLAFVIFSMIRSIQDHRTPEGTVWRQFGLGLALMVLFFATWLAQFITEWQVYTDEQIAHGEGTSIGDFLSKFGQSTLENWQS